MDGINPQALAMLAYRRIGRRGLRAGLEAEEMVAVGRAAILSSGVTAPALCVKVARNAMFDSMRREAVRVRGRVEVRPNHGFACEGEELSVGDVWDATIHAKDNLRPAAEHFDLWEAMKALTPRQYRVVSLTFWGGRTDIEIAAEIGVSRQTVDLDLRKALKKLRECLAILDPRALTDVRGKVGNTPRGVLSGEKGAQTL